MAIFHTLNSGLKGLNTCSTDVDRILLALVKTMQLVKVPYVSTLQILISVRF